MSNYQVCTSAHRTPFQIGPHSAWLRYMPRHAAVRKTLRQFKAGSFCLSPFMTLVRYGCVCNCLYVFAHSITVSEASKHRSTKPVVRLKPKDTTITKYDPDPGSCRSSQSKTTWRVRAEAETDETGPGWSSSAVDARLATASIYTAAALSADTLGWGATAAAAQSVGIRKTRSEELLGKAVIQTSVQTWFIHLYLGLDDTTCCVAVFSMIFSDYMHHF